MFVKQEVQSYKANKIKILPYLKFDFFKEISRNGSLYMLALPGIVFLLMFFYIPFLGNVLAFKQYNVIDGIFGSPWAGFKYFKFFFQSDKALSITFNTIYLNFLFIFFGLIFQMGSAILLNEVNNRYFKKASQSVVLLPYFLSWIVISGLVYSLFSYDLGSVNNILGIFGIGPINWYGNAKYWRPILLACHLWKWTGYGSIIYLAAMAGIDIDVYEAAKIDGANRIQQIRLITIPLLSQTAIVLTLLAIGRIFYGDFGMIYSIVKDNGLILSTTEVIDTYVFRAMRTTGEFSLTTAVGLYQSCAGFILVLSSNWLVKKIKGNALF